MRGESREMAGRFGGIRFRLGRSVAVVGVTMEAGLRSLGNFGGGTRDSGIEVEETVKALIANDLEGS